MERFKFNQVEGYSIEGSYPKYGTGTFKVLLQDGDYYGELVVQAGGNVQGSELIGSIINSINDMDLKIDMRFEENRKHAVVDEDGYLKGVLLYNDNGDSLEIEGEYDEDHLKHVVVGIVMTHYKLDK